MSDHLETITLEENLSQMPNVNDHGIRIQWTTMFGMSESTITKDKVLIGQLLYSVSSTFTMFR